MTLGPAERLKAKSIMRTMGVSYKRNLFPSVAWIHLRATPGITATEVLEARRRHETTIPHKHDHKSPSMGRRRGRAVFPLSSLRVVGPPLALG